MPFSLARKTTEINESAHAHFEKLLSIASIIALQVVRASFAFHLREFRGNGSPPQALRFHQACMNKIQKQRR